MTEPLTILDNIAEETTQKVEEKLPEYIIALQGYFRKQEDDFTTYLAKNNKKLSGIKPLNIPKDTPIKNRPINKPLETFVNGYDWYKQEEDLLSILKYINHNTVPFGIENAIALLNQQAKMTKKPKKKNFFKRLFKYDIQDAVTYANTPQFAADAQAYVTTNYDDFLVGAKEISKNIDSETSALIYNQLYEGIEELESMDDLAVRVGNVYDGCSQSRALMIARTETMRSFNTSTIDSYKVAKIKKAQILIANDERTCDICMPLAGLIMSVDEARSCLPLHPRCLTDNKVPIYTSKGWKPIGKIKLGDLVLTHKGRFKKVTHVFRTPKQSPNVTKMSTRNYFHQRYNLTLTDNHPILINNKWIEASEVKIGDKISMLSKKCPNCGKLTPYYRQYCSLSCKSKVVVKKQWAGPKHRENVSNKNRISMLKQYREGNRKVNLEQAHIKNKELIKLGKYIFQDPKVRGKGQQALGRRNYGKNWLEERFGWMLEQLNIEVKSQYPIKYGKDSLNRDRYYFVDFAIPENKIAIECDGSYWHKDIEKDRIRQDRIESLGWTVLRFTEEEVNKDLKSCGLEVKRILANHNKEYLFGEHEIKKIKRWKIRKPIMLYNLEVEDDNSYIAKGFVVHNCRCCWVSVIGDPILKEPKLETVQNVIEKNPKIPIARFIK